MADEQVVSGTAPTPSPIPSPSPSPSPTPSPTPAAAPADDGKVSPTLDMAKALSDISSGLGFEEKEEAGPPAVAPAPATQIPAPPAPAPALDATGKPIPSAPGPNDAPRTWRAEAAAQWAALPSEVKNEVLKRESDMFTGIESYKAEANIGKNIKTIFEPYRQIMESQQIDPFKMVQGMMMAHHTLSTGSNAERVAMLRNFVTQYRIDLNDPAAQPGAEPPFIDPQVKRLQDELDSVKSRLSAEDTRQRDAQVATMQQQVEAFEADPANVYFKDVANDMVPIIRANPGMSLKECYEKAIWTNPVVREKEIVRINKERLDKAAAEETARVAAARATSAANVKARQKSGRATTPSGSIDDTLAATLAEIKSRG